MNVVESTGPAQYTDTVTRSLTHQSTDGALSLHSFHSRSFIARHRTTT